MRRCADLRRRNVERDLDSNDEQDIEQALLRLPHLAMAKKKSGPGPDDSHDASGRADQFGRSDNLQQSEQDNAGSRSEPGNQITGGESKWADDFFERRSKHIEREEIKPEMKEVVMEEKSGDQSPKLALLDYGKKVERTKPMQNYRTGQCSSPQFDAENSDIEENESDDCRCAA